MQMNTPLLHEISRQIIDGNPWWGMALANEYLKVDDYFHKALTVRFSNRTKRERGKRELSQALRRGITTSELPADLRAQIGTRSVKTSPAIATPRKRARQARLAVRSRGTRQSRYRFLPWQLGRRSSLSLQEAKNE